MRMYKAIIRNETLDETVCILEQERVNLGKDFLKAALSWAFLESCENGIDAKQVMVEVSVDDELIFTYWLVSRQDGSSVYADLVMVTPDFREHYIRRMVIGE